MASLASIIGFFRGIDDQQKYDHSAQKAEQERLEAEQKLQFAQLKREEDARLFQLNSSALQDAAAVRAQQLEDMTANRPTEIAQRDLLNRRRAANLSILTDNFDTRTKADEAKYINTLTGDALTELKRSDVLDLGLDNRRALNPDYSKAAAALVALDPTRARQFAVNLGVNKEIVDQLSTTELTELMANPVAGLQNMAKRRVAFDAQTAQLDSRESIAANRNSTAVKTTQIRADASAAKSGGASLVGAPVRAVPNVDIAGRPPIAPAVQLGEANGTIELSKQIIAQSALVSRLESQIPPQTTGNTSRGGQGVTNPEYAAWLHRDDGKRLLDAAKAKLKELRMTRLSVQTK